MSRKITFADIVEELSDENYIPKERSQEFINTFLEVVLTEIQENGKSAITNFGSFTVVEVSARAGVNPQTGEAIEILAHKRLSFTPYKALEREVNREFSHLEATVVRDSDKESTSVAQPKPKQIVEKEQPKPPATQPEESKKELPIPTAPTESTPGTLPEKIEDDDPFGLQEEPNEEEIQENDLPITQAESENENEEESEIIDEAPNSESNDSDTSTNADSAETDETTKTATFPGLPDRKKTNSSPALLASVAVILIVVILGVWYFGFRVPETAQTATATPDIQNPIDRADADEVQDDLEASNTPFDDEESQIIPMVQPDVDLSEMSDDNGTIEQAPPSAAPPAQMITITYSVTSGVWIYEIARQTYGNTRLWPLIFQANYTLNNNPDLILPNVNLNIPQLEGTTESPSSGDYMRLAEAARYVADAYERSGNLAQAEEYRIAADRYEKNR